MSGRIVFWKYSRGFGPGTYLGAEVERDFPKDGMVSVKGYGGMRVRPIYNYNNREGTRKLKELRDAEARMEAEVKAAHERFEAERDRIFPRLPDMNTKRDGRLPDDPRPLDIAAKRKIMPPRTNLL